MAPIFGARALASHKSTFHIARVKRQIEASPDADFKDATIGGRDDAAADKRPDFATAWSDQSAMNDLILCRSLAAGLRFLPTGPVSNQTRSVSIRQVVDK